LQSARAKNRQESYDELEEKALKGLKKKSEKSGIPYGILKKVYDRGMAAWRTGHRPGATQQQWAYARVNSFLTGGKTRTTADADLWKKAKAAKKAKKESVGEENPCWDGYKQVGMKTGKDGKPVPNCVREDVELDEARAKKAVAGGKVQKLVTGFGMTYKGKKYDEIDFELVSIDNSSQIVTFRILHPREHIGDKVRIPFKTLRLGRFMATDTSKINEAFELEEMPRWLLEPLSKITRKKGYEAAKKVLDDVLARKKKEAGRKGLQHSIEYYAGQIARQFDGVDARVLAKMVNEEPEKMGPVEVGTNEIRKRYSDMTPGQKESYPRHALKLEDLDENFVMENSVGMGQTLFAGDLGIKAHFGFEHHPDTIKEMEACCDDCSEELEITEAEYQGRKVKLNDPFRTPKGPKKFSVYVKNEKGNVVKVNFGSPDMEIKRDNPERRKSFRARHNCDNPGPKTKARYWSCRMWEKGKTVSELD
jgi:hypothetical protein